MLVGSEFPERKYISSSLFGLRRCQELILRRFDHRLRWHRFWTCSALLSTSGSATKFVVAVPCIGHVLAGAGLFLRISMKTRIAVSNVAHPEARWNCGRQFTERACTTPQLTCANDLASRFPGFAGGKRRIVDPTRTEKRNCTFPVRPLETRKTHS